MAPKPYFPRLKRLALLALLALPSLVALAGCGRSVNMATAQSPTWNATTIPYAGVREEIRQYPDYSIINAGVLTADTAGARKPGPGKQGAPR